MRSLCVALRMDHRYGTHLRCDGRREARKAEPKAQGENVAGIGILLEQCIDGIWIKVCAVTRPPLCHCDESSVQAVASGGPAQKSDKVKPGMRLLSIDRQARHTRQLHRLCDCGCACACSFVRSSVCVSPSALAYAHA